MKDKDKQKTKTKNMWLWPVKILLLAVFFSLGFSLLSEVALSNTSVVVAIIVIFVFIALGIFFDMLGIAVASASVEPFASMAARKVKGSKQAIILVKNADKVSSICNDVFGDICGILAGAAGASIVAKIIISGNQNFLSILIPSIVSAIIAGLTIFGKAVFKSYGIKHSNSITLKLAKFINFFTKKG